MGDDSKAGEAAAPSRFARIPMRDYDAYANAVGSPFDPYFVWYYMKPFGRMFYGMFGLEKDYGKWDLYSDVMTTGSIDEVMADRSEPIPEESQDTMGQFFRYDRALYPDRRLDDDMFLTYNYMTPYFWNFLSDASMLPTAKYNDRCTRIEIDALECIEYYGLRQGRPICRDYFDDLVECRRGPVKNMRFYAMRLEQNKRWVEYKKGLREYDTVYKPNPKVHATVEPMLRMGDMHGPVR